MFRGIGGAVVYGLALYGAVKLFERPKMEPVIQPGGNHDEEERSAAAGEPSSQNDKVSVDPANKASMPPNPTGSA
jgi:hypothetical protein